MLVNLKTILNLAEVKKCAVGAFNTPNYESIRAVTGAAEELNQPVIVMHAQIHEEMGLCKMEEIAPLMLYVAERASVPVCVHLDHGTDLGYVKRGIDLGFTSVMYDGSEHDFKINRANTCVVSEIAKRRAVSVEAEVGSMGAREMGAGGDSGVYTDPELAAQFARDTGIDALAYAFGTAHGVYHAKPELDLDRVKRIHSILGVPIVMHGGSGISEADYREVIACGVRKINYYTYMAKAGGEAVGKMTDRTFFHDIAAVAEKGMRENVKAAIKVFSRCAACQ